MRGAVACNRNIRHSHIRAKVDYAGKVSHPFAMLINSVPFSLAESVTILRCIGPGSGYRCDVRLVSEIYIQFDIVTKVIERSNKSSLIAFHVSTHFISHFGIFCIIILASDRSD